MGKEQSPDLNNMSEEELRVLFKKAEAEKDYELQLLLYNALLPYEENKSAAYAIIGDLIEYLNQNSNKEINEE